LEKLPIGWEFNLNGKCSVPLFPTIPEVMLWWKKLMGITDAYALKQENGAGKQG